MSSNIRISHEQPKHDRSNRYHLLPWSEHLLPNFFLVKLRLNYLKFWLFIFSVYWFIPLIFTFLDGTVITKSSFNYILSTVHMLFNNFPYIVDTISSYSNNIVLIKSTDLGYLNDVTHFVFTLILAFGGSFFAYSVRKFDLTIINLLDNEVFKDNYRYVRYIYNYYRNRACNRKYIYLSIIPGLCSSALFLYISFDYGNKYWWGSIYNGVSGLVFTVIIFIMVSSGIYGIILLIYGSLMLSKIATVPITLQIFNDDGCNGMQPLGRQILLLWADSAFATLAIYVTLYLGYLNIEKSLIVWSMAIFGAAVIPVIAIFPFISIVRTVKRARDKLLKKCKPTLDRMFIDIISENDSDSKLNVNGNEGLFSNTLDLYNYIKTINVWPYNTRTIISAVLLNVFNIIYATREFILRLF